MSRRADAAAARPALKSRAWMPITRLKDHCRTFTSMSSGADTKHGTG
jgi:hypothetical protein